MRNRVHGIVRVGLRQSKQTMNRRQRFQIQNLFNVRRAGPGVYVGCGQRVVSNLDKNKKIAEEGSVND